MQISKRPSLRDPKTTQVERAAATGTEYASTDVFFSQVDENPRSNSTMGPSPALIPHGSACVCSASAGLQMLIRGVVIVDDMGLLLPTYRLIDHQRTLSTRLQDSAAPKRCHSGCN